MSDLEPVPDGIELRRGEAGLDEAARQLRALDHPRRVEIADRVLTRALAAPRRSHLVRAHGPHDYLRVSTLAITGAMREHLDRHLVGAAVGRILFDVDRDGELTALTIELYVQYGTEIMPTGDLARELGREVLTSLLGERPAGEDLPVTLSHVHVSDVTVGDPHVVDPSDELH
ncbi:hypothetical protein SAMN04489844_0908 [Nocardioides exalbidus]|uniref:Uncharacterized protein n=1 Tax=Nocardioides exalbidus TaxID=402596 RepID=A0A1H4LLQ5_9ACTN|nr:hypothetical protein [Nocardioides exalbidus]SEB71607.1 hypothetical protein SAMN04489844_0908 [Nocardioides exalbidus]